MQELKISISTGVSADGFNWTFQDEASGLVLLRLTLTHEEMGKALAGFTSMDEFSATVLESTAYTHVGKRAYYFRRTFRCEDLSILEAFRKGKTPADLEAWASEVTTRCWVTNPSWSVNNSQRVTFRAARFDNDLTDEKSDQISTCLLSFNAPKGLISK